MRMNGKRTLFMSSRMLNGEKNCNEMEMDEIALSISDIFSTLYIFHTFWNHRKRSRQADQ